MGDRKQEIRRTNGAAAETSTPAEAVAAVYDRRPNPEENDGGHRPPLQDKEEGEKPTWPDEAAESAFLAEARERGEPIASKPRDAEPVEEADPKSLPSLNELVERIPAEVRETLDELFRARFVRVQRVPKKALKG